MIDSPVLPNILCKKLYPFYLFIDSILQDSKDTSKIKKLYSLRFSLFDRIEKSQGETSIKYILHKIISLLNVFNTQIPIE